MRRDPLGGSSGPVYREDIEVAFALFRASKYDPILDTSILEPASANVSDTFLAGVDRIANRFSRSCHLIIDLASISPMKAGPGD